MALSSDDVPLLHPGSARSVLLTILGELVAPEPDEPVWTVSFVEVMSGLGFEERTTRQAIDRAADSGWIDGERVGRSVRWTLTEEAKALIDAGEERVHSIGGMAEPWDGRWLVTLITIPTERRGVRKRLYAALAWEGLGMASPGLWLTPHAERALAVERIIHDLGLRDITFSFVGPSAQVGLDDHAIVERAWDLSGLEIQYRRLIDALERDEAVGDSLLTSHLRLVNQWQRLPFRDPQLPEEILPSWVGRDAARLLQDRREKGAAAAQAEWRTIQRRS